MLKHRQNVQEPRNRRAAAKVLVQNLTVSSSIWSQTIPTKNCDVVVSIAPKFDDVSCDWLLGVLGRSEGIIIGRYCDEKSGYRGLFITATYECLLRVAESACIHKSVEARHGGGNAAFTQDNRHIFSDNLNAEGFFTVEERQRIIRYLVMNIRARSRETIQHVQMYEGESIVSRLEARGLIQVFPLHNNHELCALRQSWVCRIARLQPIDDVCGYFGVKVALYFSYLGHYTTALIVPTVIGCYVWFNQGDNQATNDGYFMAFALFNVLWATLFLVSWKRRSAELSQHWGTADVADDLLQEPRPTYRGVLRHNDVTGHTELHYPSWKRHVFRYFVTIPVMCLCLFVVFYVMFQIYQLQDHLKGLVKAEQLPRLTRFVPIILLAIIIPVLDSIYNVVARWLNDMENYRLQETYSNHLIIKLVLFQFVNHFLSLFYAAFYLRDMTRLRELLATILITRQIIGNLNETLRPYLAWKGSLLRVAYSITSALTPQEKGTDGQGPVTLALSQGEVEARMTKYEDTFSDYLEMVIQFGYVVLFSSAFPLAALCAFINNIVEIRSDAFKLCYTLQRPFGHRVHNIGSWQTALEVLVLISVMVNCGLVYVFGHVQRLLHADDTYAIIAIIVAVEHVIIILQYLLSYAIPDTPAWIVAQRAKSDFMRREAERKLKSQQRLVSAPPPQGKCGEQISTQLNHIDVNDSPAKSTREPRGMDLKEELHTGGVAAEQGSQNTCETFVKRYYVPCRTEYLKSVSCKRKSFDSASSVVGYGHAMKIGVRRRLEGVEGGVEGGVECGLLQRTEKYENVRLRSKSVDLTSMGRDEGLRDAGNKTAGKVAQRIGSSRWTEGQYYESGQKVGVNRRIVNLGDLEDERYVVKKSSSTGKWNDAHRASRQTDV